MREKDESQIEPANRQGRAQDEPAFGLLLAVVVAGLGWVALAAVVIALWR